jgi:hypothetical protein
LEPIGMSERGSNHTASHNAPIPAPDAVRGNRLDNLASGLTGPQASKGNTFVRRSLTAASGRPALRVTSLGTTSSSTL